MKKILVIMCFLTGFTPFWSNAQLSCFSSQTTIEGLSNSLNDGVQCALPFYEEGCIGIPSALQQISFGPSSSTNYMEECGFICSDDEPGPYGALFQAELIKSAIAIASPFAPTCAATGESKVIVDITFTDAYCFDCNGGRFIDFIVTYACCEVADDCSANFTIEESPKDCNLYLENRSTASSINDCGDCDNPAGITNVTWEVYEYVGFFPYVGVSLWLTSNDWNFNFDPADSPNGFSRFQVCLTIEDCLGCESRVCEDVFLFPPCKPSELTGGQEEQLSKRIELQSTEKVVSIFPNPSDGQVNIRLKGKDWKEGQSTIEIYGLQGKLVKAVQQVNAADNTIDVSSLVPGMYIITVHADGRRIHTEKLIIE